MCGIVGLISKSKYSGFTGIQQKMMHQLLYADALRGVDATGIIAINKHEDFSIAKAAIPAVDFLEEFKDSEIDKGLYKDGIAFIGHNRAKTIGENKDENAHPFVEEKTFAMVHNGTLYNHKKMLSDTDVDSHALTIAFKEAMHQDDWKKAMEDTLAKVTGAFACVWYDQTKHEVCMIRNSQRPLSIVETDSSILFGSEMSLLHWIAFRNNDKIKASKSLDTSTLYSFDLKKQGGDFSETFLSMSPPKIIGFSNGIITSNQNTTDPNPKTTTTTSPNNGETIKEMMAARASVFDGNDKREEVSRNAYKKLRAQVFRKRIRFEVEDVVATGNRGEFMLFGESLNGAYDLCDVRHSIRCLVTLKGLGIHAASDMWHQDFELEGTIHECEYDKDNKSIILYIEKALNVSETSYLTH